MKTNNLNNAVGHSVGHEEKDIQNTPLDPAREAGLAKVIYFKTDKWIIENNHNVVTKNTVPPALANAFVKTSISNPVTSAAVYDRTKFSIHSCSYDGEPSLFVRIHSHALRDDIAEITLEKDTFSVRLFNQPKKGVFPFSKDEFLKAINSAKWVLEIDLENISD